MPVEQKVDFANIDRFATAVKREMMTEVTEVVYQRTVPLVPVGRRAHKRGQDQRHLKDRMERRVGSGGGYGVVKANAPHAHLVIKGTGPHVIRPKQGKEAILVGGKHPVSVVEHPGSRSNDFLKRGLDASRDAVEVAAGKDILARVRVR